MTGLLERTLNRDRWVVAGILGLVTVASALWTLRGGGIGMSAWQLTAETGFRGALIGRVPDMALPGWTLGNCLVILAMWWLMMVAMMVPSAAPTVLLYGALHLARGLGGMLEFLAGYLAIWAAFSALATAAQAWLVALGAMSGMYMNLAWPWLGAAVLFAAGSYQWTPLKAACLRSCRGPVEALIANRRSGRLAAFRTGALHGRACLGCCWGLMALLFVGGVMNLRWIIGVAALVALEKPSVWGAVLSRPLGAALMLGGAFWRCGRQGGWDRQSGGMDKAVDQIADLQTALEAAGRGHGVLLVRCRVCRV